MLFATRKLKELELEIVTQAPTGTISITENGTVDVTDYAFAEVNVDYSTVNFNLPEFTRTAPTGLSQARSSLAATTVGNYALFGGGAYANSTVDAYNILLTRTTPTALSEGRRTLAATTVGNYALFGGGYSSNYFSTVDAYNTSLTRTTPTELSIGRCDMAATTVGDYALFGGGAAYNTSNTTRVDAYNNSLTRTTPTELSQGLRANLAATTVGNYALFGGGARNVSNPTYYATVDSYNTSLTRTTPTELSIGRCYMAATTVGNYALFGGGRGSGYVYYSVVDAYDTSLTRTTPTGLSQERSNLAATTVGNYALFGGGYGVKVESIYDEDLEEYIEERISIKSNVVDVYNSSLTRTTPTELSQGRYNLAATTVGNYALFAGGDAGSYSDVVDAYSPPDYDIQLFPGTKYSFNGAAESTSPTWQTISIQGPAVGYAKIKNTTVS